MKKLKKMRSNFKRQQKAIDENNKAKQPGEKIKHRTTGKQAVVVNGQI